MTDNSSNPRFNLDERYNQAKNTIGDIHEHIDVLYGYVIKSGEKDKPLHITECGVATCVSSWAFAKGLRDAEGISKTLVSVDPFYHPNIADVRKVCKNNGINFTFKQGSDLHVELEDTDILFIDTWHVNGQLRRELAKLAPKTRKYIIMHDTTVDAELGETVRRGWNAFEQSEEHDMPIQEIVKGLWSAVTEFLENHSDEWKLDVRLMNCNGLTILKRIS
jgi:hypothetical protein